MVSVKKASPWLDLFSTALVPFPDGAEHRCHIFFFHVFKVFLEFVLEILLVKGDPRTSQQ